MEGQTTLSGTKYDGGKVRIDLIPAPFLFAVATILTFGAQKYGDYNWAQGLKWSRVFAALMRHLWSWWGGQGPTGTNFVFGNTDDETKHSHLWHAACCIVFLVCYEEWKIGEDDRQKANTIN